MKFGFWILITTGILLSILLLTGQTLALFEYDLTVAMGLQESESEVGKVGIAYAKGFGFGDTVIYLPLLFVGIFGLLKHKKWGFYTMFGALAITAYWPLVCLFAVLSDRVAITLTPEKYLSYSILLPSITIYGVWGMWFLYRLGRKAGDN
ncbi:hypothetical protein K8I28_07575 [bacterium]|nr:hypothetical protein [bacterium]